MLAPGLVSFGRNQGDLGRNWPYTVERRSISDDSRGSLADVGLPGQGLWDEMGVLGGQGERGRTRRAREDRAGAGARDGANQL